MGVVGDDQPDAREGQAGRSWVAERFVVPKKPGNAGGGKGPQFKTDARRGEGPGDWATSHGELWVKGDFIPACVKLRGQFRYPRSEPDCMTRPVSEHDQPHIRSPLEAAAPTSRLRRAGAQGTKPFYQSAYWAMVTIGSSPGSARTDKVLEDLNIW